MTYEPYLIFAAAGFIVWLCIEHVARSQHNRQVTDHDRATAIENLGTGYYKAHLMVQTYGLSAAQRQATYRYIDLLEARHYELDQGETELFKELRQSLYNHSCGLRVVV